MRIAICFHGLPRLIQRCYPDIYKYFIENNDVDIYAHFWWDQSHKGKINRLHVKERNDINENPIEAFEKLYKPKKVVHEDCPKFDLSNYPIQGYSCDNIRNDTKSSKIMASFLLYGFYSRFLSVNKCINLVENVEQYDMIICLRTDLLLLKAASFYNEAKNLDISKYIYLPSSMCGGPKYAGEHPNKIGDWVYFGTPLNIINFNKNVLKDLATKTYENCSVYPKSIEFGKYNFFQLNDILSDINSSYITPIHNTERWLYWSKVAQVPLNIYKNSISIRRYIVEEHEDKNYILSNKICPERYIELFNIRENCMKDSELLPFYTKNITFIK